MYALVTIISMLVGLSTLSSGLKTNGRGDCRMDTDWSRSALWYDL